MTSPTADAVAPATAARRAPSPLAKMLGLTAGLGVILVVLLMLFVMPSLKSGAQNLPLGGAGGGAGGGRGEVWGGGGAGGGG
ncbi:hypothetical protein, partial [Microbacterium sp. zg.Y909]|uniref:hypothetical protein n=1 Tax=Microbacterium sp. zg.Y909 TaxID=2969413 RepID=UPI003F902FC8|nr:citrate:proton symporter [Microbacterium sp. zg.Y909]